MSILMLVSFVFAYVGYPSWKLSGTLGGAYPCQYSQCGCRTAEQCRTSCCCHTKQEKIVWALDRGIDPNNVAVLTEQEKSQYAAQRTVDIPAKLCCATSAGKPVKKSCCSSTPETAAPMHAGCVDGGCDTADSTSGLTFVLAISAQKCGGAGLEWIEAGFVAAPPPVSQFVIAPRQVPAVNVVDPGYAPPVSGQLLRPV